MKSTPEKVKSFYNGFIDKLSMRTGRHDYICRSLDRLIPRKGSVLDLGCGAGITSKHLAESGHDVLAVDLSDVAIKKAMDENNHPKIKYLCGDISTLKLGETYDCIVLADVLEHLMPEAVANLVKLIKDCSHGGTSIYLNVPDGKLLKWLNSNKKHLTQIVDRPIYHNEVIEMFRDIHFAPIYYNFYWQEYIEYLFVTEDMVAKLFSIKYKGA